MTNMIKRLLVAPDSCAVHSSNAADTAVLDDPVIPPRGDSKLALNEVVSDVAAEINLVDADVADVPGKATAEKVDAAAMAEMSSVSADIIVFCAVITEVSDADRPPSLSSTMKQIEEDSHTANAGVPWFAMNVMNSRNSV